MKGKPIFTPSDPRSQGKDRDKNRKDDDCGHGIVKALERLTCVVEGILQSLKKPKTRLSIEFGKDEPIPKEPHMKLTKPIKPGFRRPFTITPDEPVDVNSAGTYVQVNVLAGDSTVTIDAAGTTATSIKGWLNGDGAVGPKSVEFIVDGHVGEGDQQVALTVDFDVSTPDATTLGFVEGTDEPIPA